MIGYGEIRSRQWLAGLTGVVVRQAAQAWLMRMTQCGPHAAASRATDAQDVLQMDRRLASAGCFSESRIILSSAQIKYKCV